MSVSYSNTNGSPSANSPDTMMTETKPMLEIGSKRVHDIVELPDEEQSAEAEDA